MSKCEGFDQEMHIYKQRYARHNKQSTIFTPPEIMYKLPKDQKDQCFCIDIICAI